MKTVTELKTKGEKNLVSMTDLPHKLSFEQLGDPGQATTSPEFCLSNSPLQSFPA